MVRSSIEDARVFLRDARRIAVVGVSRDRRDFSRYVLRALRGHGYDAVPVNPGLTEAEGVAAAARACDLDPPPDSALLMIPPAAAEEALRDLLRCRVRRVWLHRGAGPGVASAAVLALCAANRLEVVHGLCPMMVLPHAALPHRVHLLFRRALAHPDHPHACGVV